MNEEQRRPSEPGSDHPLIALGRRVIKGELTLEQALEGVSSQAFLERLDDDAIAISGARVQQIAERQPQVASVFARLNYAAVVRLRADHRLADDRLVGHCVLSLANAYSRLGRFSEALSLYAEAREVFQRNGMAVDVATCDLNMAIVYEQLNQFERALSLYAEARKVFQQNGMAVDVARCDLNMAVVYQQLDRYEEALSLYERARTVFEENRMPVSVATCDLNRAVVYEQLNRYEEALDLCERTRAVFEENHMPVDVARCDQNRAVVYAQLDRYEEALDLCERARAVFEENHMPVDVAGCDLNRAVVYQRLNRYEEALDLYERVLREGPQIPEITWRCRWGLGWGHKERDRPRAAYRHLVHAIRTLETLRGALPKEQVLSPFFEDKTEVYQEMAATCLRFQRADRALEYAERSKSRNLLELLARQDLQPQESVPQGLVDEYRRLRLKLRELQYRLEREQEAETQAEYDWTLEKIKVYDANFTAAVRVEPIPSHQIQELLPDPETAIVEFFLTGEHVLAFVVTRGDISHGDISHRVIEEFTPQDLADQWRRWIEGYQRFRDYGDRRAWLQTLDEVLERLYDKMFRQVREAIPDSIRKLIFIPYHYLHFFPLHALYREEGGQRRYLLEDYEEISYTPSASVLKHCRGRGRRGREKLFAVSDPDGTLKHSREEVEAIQARFEEKRILGNPPRGKKISYDPATVERCLAETPEYHAIHFACHGQYDFLNPLRSHLRLSDGELTLGEVFARLHLPQARLVVLSACETGITELSRADEWVGLAGGFLHAGAPAVISSLWAVADHSTSLLMKRVYDNLLDGGMSVAQALNEAQRAFLRGKIPGTPVEGQEKFGITADSHTVTVPDERDEKALEDYRHPFYWAAFTVSGAG